MRFTDYPFLILGSSLLLLWLAGVIGAFVRKQKRHTTDIGADAGIILGATLTLLGLIIGFTFSMAIGRYEQRKTCEEAEANAIGTEYFRADLLPVADAQQLRKLMASYTIARLSFYQSRNGQELHRVKDDTDHLQQQLWLSITRPAMLQPTALTALVVSGMNDVLNSEGYTQAAWLNRIPVSAWWLMLAIALCCNLLIGYCLRRVGDESVVFAALTLIVSISFFLIADIDSPRRGIIHVYPENLVNLSHSLQR